MNLSDALWLLGAFAALIGVGAAVHGYTRADLAQHIASFQSRVDTLDARQVASAAEVAALREELHRDYLHRGAAEALRADLRVEFAEVKRDFREVFNRLRELGENLAAIQGPAYRRPRDGGADQDHPA